MLKRLYPFCKLEIYDVTAKSRFCSHRRQRSEIRGQRSDVRGQRSEVRRQRSEVSKNKDLCRLFISELFISRLFAGASSETLCRFKDRKITGRAKTLEYAMQQSPSRIRKIYYNFCREIVYVSRKI